ncbi:4-carboxymuconolactone decarboxylase [Mycobacterium sp. MAA66]|uniref:carboxymuconolactone decarboxylase family protein n=1 Tax=Mycobacterium sp. MAA66 TaxID=3156297 RepID=UPI003517F41B
MSRIPLTTAEGQPEAIRRFMARRGDLNLFRLLANTPQVFTGWTQLVDEMLDSPTFTVRMRELIILRVAHLQRSPYELSQHVGLASAAGLTDTQVGAITGDLDTAEFGRTERVVLDLVTELCTTHRLHDDTFAAAHDALGDAAITELLMIISCYYGLALVLNAVDLEVDETARIQL